MKLSALCLYAGLALVSPCGAATIVAYDITAVPHNDPGCGGWCSTFNGTITPNASYSGYDDYSYGSGTLNDGFVGQYTNNQLLALYTSPSVTLYLDAPSHIESIDIFGWSNAFINNYIPGALNGLTVTIGGISRSFTTTQFGPSCIFGLYLCNDHVSLNGSGLQNISTNEIRLSNFQMDKTGIGPTTGYVNLAEVVVNAAPVPEPNGALLFGVGFLALAWRRAPSAAR